MIGYVVPFKKAVGPVWFDQLDLAGQETGYYDIAVDVAQAGPGDTVLVIDEGNGARQVLNLDPGAIRAVIVGIVDQVALD